MEDNRMFLQVDGLNVERLEGCLDAFKAICAAQAEKESLENQFALEQIGREELGRRINGCLVRLDECDIRLSEDVQLRRALLKMKNVYDYEPQAITLDDFQRFLGL